MNSQKLNNSSFIVSSLNSDSKDLSVISSEHNMLLQAFQCAIGGRVATYVSGPITTGPRFIDWYVATGFSIEIDSKEYQKSKYEQVLLKNEMDIVVITETLRKNATVPVIEPASLRIRAWNQHDYYLFWTELMRRFVSRVVALDGWQYSIGCVIEFHHAIQFGIRVESLDGKLLNEESAHKLIHDAAEDIELRGSSFELLKQMAQKLISHDWLYGETSA